MRIDLFLHQHQCDQIWRFFWTLGTFLKPLATINLSKSPTFLGKFREGVKIFHFSSEIIFLGNFYRHLAISSGHTDQHVMVSLGHCWTFVFVLFVSITFLQLSHIN